MKKLKQILALTGAVLLVCMYLATLIFAAPGLFKASVAATILIPVLLYAFILITRLLKDRSDDQRNDHSDI